MKIRGLIIAGSVLATVSVLLAADFWDKPFREWKRDQAVKLLQDSPWAKQVVLSDQRGGRDTRNVGGEMDVHHVYTIRFFTALPVRQSYVRLVQIGNNYDELSADDQKAFDQAFSRALAMDTSNEIIVSLEFSSNERQTSMDVERQLRQITADQLRQSVFLITDEHGRIDLISYFPPSPDGTGAKFVFPRVIDGQPAVTAEDREVRFELSMPGTDHRVYATWKIRDMLYGGELAL